MQEFSLSELNRRPGEIVDRALAGPILLKKHGRPQLVLMSIEEFERLTAGATCSPGQAPAVESTSPKPKLAALTRSHHSDAESPDQQ